MTARAPIIFIIHASADRQLALMLKGLLIEALQKGTAGLTVFCSSDFDIKGGKRWFDQIMENLKLASACVAIMTPQSIYYSPWVAFEAGGAYLRFEINPKRSRLFPVCAYGIAGSNLPSPFKELQVRNLAAPKEVLTLCHELAQCIGKRTSKKPRRLITSLSAEAAKGSPYWSFVSPALVGQRQGSSPFSLESLLNQATRDVFCAGFNLFHIATTTHIKTELFNFMRNSPHRSVRILVSNPRKHRDFAAWRLVGSDYLTDLQRSTRNFWGWIAEAKKQKLEGQLSIRLASFIALNVLGVDADTSNGQLVVTPAIFRKPLSVDRPHFWLSRARQPEVFCYYWDSYQELFRRSTPIQDTFA